MVFWKLRYVTLLNYVELLCSTIDVDSAKSHINQKMQNKLQEFRHKPNFTLYALT